MRVKDLIEKLKKMPPSAQVWTARHDFSEGWLVDQVDVVELDKHGDVILRRD